MPNTYIYFPLKSSKMHQFRIRNLMASLKAVILYQHLKSGNRNWNCEFPVPYIPHQKQAFKKASCTKLFFFFGTQKINQVQTQPKMKTKHSPQLAFKNPLTENIKSSHHFPIKMVLSFGVQETAHSRIKGTMPLAGISRFEI